MQEVSRVVHRCLQRSVQVWVGLSARAEAHAFTQIIPTARAIVAPIAFWIDVRGSIIAIMRMVLAILAADRSPLVVGVGIPRGETRGKVESSDAGRGQGLGSALVATGFPALDSHTTAHRESEEGGDIGTYRGNDPSSFVSEHQRLTESKVPVASVNIIMHY